MPKTFEKRESPVVVRFKKDLKELLREVARARGEDVSDLVRRAVKIELARLSFLSESEKKALGIAPESTGQALRKHRSQAAVASSGRVSAHGDDLGGAPNG